MKRGLAILLCLAWSGAALAAGPAAVRKRVQASMLLTGTIEVAPDGSVAQYALDQPEKVPEAVKGLLTKSVATWRFQPVEVDGKPMAAKASMSVRVVASPLGNDNFSLGVAGAWFGEGASRQSDASAQTISYKKRQMPRYPMDAAYSGVQGIVYVLLKIGRDGRVVDAAAETVNLRVVASDEQLQVWRRVLAEAALTGLRHDTFNVPTAGPEAGKPYWVARVPVTFQLNGGTPAGYGQWQAYVPGPVQEPDWADKDKLAGSPDAVPEGGILLAEHSLRLLTPPGGS